MQIPYKLSNLKGYRLQTQDGEIGKLKQIYFDDQHWVVRYFVVQTGTWLTAGKDVLIVPSVISAVDEKNECLKVALSRNKIQNCPPVNSALPVSRHYEQEYFRYYGWEPYWQGNPLFTPEPAASTTLDTNATEENTRLRSSEEIVGFPIHAIDGEIGHVKDIILEEPEGTICYLEIDTRNWLPGKHVLIAPTWIKQIDWSRKVVAVDLPQAIIESAPAYDPSEVIGRDYQVALYGHYGKAFLKPVNN